MPSVIEKLFKFKFLIISAVAVFIAICVYFLLSLFSSKPESMPLFQETEKNAETESITPQSSRIFFQPLSYSTKSYGDLSEAQSLEVPILPIPKPDLMELRKKEDTPSKTVLAFFENVSTAAKAAEESIGRQVSAPTVSSPGALSGKSLAALTSEEIVLSLTKDEFNFLYPEYFLKTLAESQTLLKEYDPTFEPLSKVEKDSDVRFIQEKIIVALLSANMINKVEAERFITTLRFTLPQLQLMELQTRKQAQKTFFSKFAGKIYNIFSHSKNSQGVFLAGLTERLKNAFLPEAEAGGGGSCGECHPLPLCFQEGLSPLPIPGPVFLKLFCQCTGCLFGQGCLDICVGRAALYDPITGICGCGM